MNPWQEKGIYYTQNRWLPFSLPPAQCLRCLTLTHCCHGNTSSVVLYVAALSVFNHFKKQISFTFFLFFFFFLTTSPYNNAQYKVMNGLTDYGLFHTVHESSAHLIKCLLLTGYRSHRLHERALFLDRAVVSIMQHCHFKSTTSVILLLWLCCWITFTPLDK